MPRRHRTKTPRPALGLPKEISGLLLFVAAAFALISLFWPEFTGQAGRVSNYLLELGFGSGGAVVFSLAALYYSAYLTLARRASLRVGLSLALLVGAGLGFLFLVIPPIQRPLLTFSDGGSVGAVGLALGRLSVSMFGVVGAWILVWSTVVIGLLLLTGSSLRDGVRLGVNVGAKGYNWVRGQLQAQAMPKPAPAATNEAEEPSPEPTRPEIPEPRTQERRLEQLKLPQCDYTLPDLILLNRGLKPSNARGSREEKDNIRILEETLANFGIMAKVVDVTRGPTCTRYEIQMAPGTKVSKVTGLSNDLAMSLASEGVRIEAPIPGKAAIGIEVPNKARSSVLLRDVLESAEYINATAPLTAALGKDIEGNTVVADLAQMPHLLIAGATGTGKSVCINTLVCSVLFKARPDEVKLMLIDPKVVELSAYNGVPHLIAPVLNHPKKAAAALKWATSEMERRYAAFARAGVRDIDRFNERAKEKATERMPLILIVIDELADLMMVARNDVEEAICRLAQMARAAGMHLVIGTQRPSTDVITGLIKANIPSRLSFTVSSAVDSRVILDMMGAEKLLGRGDMLFLPVGQSKARRVQGAFVSNREIERVVDFVSSQGEAAYVDALDRLEETDHTAREGEGGLDERFDDAVRIVVETGQASVSMLQRRMRLGYSRAARIVDQMQEAGIVGPADGSKPRSINKNHVLVKAIHDQAKRSGIS
ncbi:MAG: DNA translocase SpoIIIE [Firmicutes bacterium]|nr:DNA translocase SpoIIIE [candidate division NPL-UPA2 bacterium]